MAYLNKFLPSDKDTWHWRLAQLDDVDDIVAMAQTHFQNEIQHVFDPDPALYAKHVSLAVVEQSFDLLKCQLIVARDKITNQLKSYAWLNRGHFMVYAREECAEAAFAHMDMTLPKRERFIMMAQILLQWEMWCKITQIPVLVSTTIRTDQKGFLRLHEEAGYEIRGSFAFKKIELL